MRERRSWIASVSSFLPPGCTWTMSVGSWGVFNEILKRKDFAVQAQVKKERGFKVV